MWNANSVVQDLNSYFRAHFQRRQPFTPRAPPFVWIYIDIDFSKTFKYIHSFTHFYTFMPTDPYIYIYIYIDLVHCFLSHSHVLFCAVIFRVLYFAISDARSLPSLYCSVLNSRPLIAVHWGVTYVTTAWGQIAYALSWPYTTPSSSL